MMYIDVFVSDGSLVERIVWLIGNHEIQVIRYDRNNKAVYVKVDSVVKQLPLSKVNAWIRARL